MSDMRWSSEFSRGFKCAIDTLAHKGDYQHKDWSEPYQYLLGEWRAHSVDDSVPPVTMIGERYVPIGDGVVIKAKAYFEALMDAQQKAIVKGEKDRALTIAIMAACVMSAAMKS